ncbi:MAG: ABC transporter substrate-binding protein [Azonexus sp.]|uniref:ABC transporter substrate-binding protein n=1 Tax=Azonexus sp. TaxID=1872668 RepID=UPI002822745E|nr:ABC transporter substrate-binding protein [Azonexus sp.]MDR0775456.1 ABC transporter substrate-binding protein [Azonexus sp.]
MKRFIILLCAVLATPAAYSQAPARIVSLDLCTDWMLARYADRTQVAALSPMHRQYPVAWLDNSWPAHDATLERIVELRPDLVITGQYNALQLRSRLQTLGFRVEILPLPTSLDTVTQYEERFLSLLGKPLSLASPPRAAMKTQAEPKRLLLLGANGIGTGRGTFEDAILERAGWANYLRDDGYLRLDLERIATDPPDAILWAAPRSKALANRFAEHPVLRQAVPREHWLSTDYWRWQCPGPWTWELVGQLQRWLQ